MAKKPLRIGYLFDDSLDRPDGVQQYVRTLGRWYRDKGHSVTYLVGQTSSPPDEGIAMYSLAKNISVAGNRNRLSLPMPAKKSAIKKALNSQFDVIHVQMPYNPLLSGRVINQLKPTTALVGTFHIVADTKREIVGSKLLARWQSQQYGRFDETIAVSAAAKDFAQKYFSLKTVVVPNAVELELFRMAKPRDASNRGWHLAYLGRLVERKGVRHLLEAINILHQQNQLDDVTVHIGGSGPLGDSLKAYVSDHGLNKSVVFHGFIDESDKPGFLTAADVSIFPAVGGESFGIVLVEAMAAGSLVLAGDNAGYSTVLDGRTDMLFDPQDTTKLATLITSIRQDRRAFTTIKNWQQHRVQRYDVGRVANKLESIYRRSITNRLARKA